MKLKDIYRIAIEEAIKIDPRGRTSVEKELKSKKDIFGKLDKKAREEFDQESLNNPYADTRILNGDNDKDIKCVLAGIDIGVEEILLADWLNFKSKKKINLCIAHHPQGVALAGLHEVMAMQADILANFGIPVNVGEGLLQNRIEEVSRRIHPANHNRSVDVARLLGMPMMCMHTVADNFATNYIQGLMNKKKPEKIGEVISILKEIPEYQLAIQDKSGPKIIMGDANRKTGRILVEMTGGTEGPKEMIDKYEQAGIGTVISMHLSEEHYKNAKGKNINLIIAGHIASDNVGLNLLLDKILQKGKFEIICCSGFRRIKR